MILLLLSLLLLFCQSIQAQVVSLIIPQEVTVEKVEILLKDVAFITGDDAALMEKLGEISLGTSPLPSTPRILSRQSILLRIEREDIDLNLLEIEAPERVEIRSLFPYIQESDLEETLYDHLFERMEMDLGWLEVEYLQGADSIYYPQGDLEILLRRTLQDPRSYLGETTIPMEIYVDGHRWRQIYPRFFIEIKTLVPVLKKDLSRHEIITSELVEIKLKGLSTLPLDYIHDEEEIFGMRLKRRVEKGEPLRTSYIEAVPLVERGDRVTILAIIDSITLSLLGEARGTGIYGDMIQVRNLDSNRLLSCRIIGPGLVQIELGGI